MAVITRLGHRRSNLSLPVDCKSEWLHPADTVMVTILRPRFFPDNIDWVWGFYKRFGNVYAMWIGNDLVVITSNPDDIEVST